MPDLLFAALGRSRIFLIRPLQPTVDAYDLFFHSPRIRSKTQQCPSNLHRSRRKVRRHVLLRLVEKPPPIRAGRFRDRNLNQIIIVPHFLNRLRRASSFNSRRGQASLPCRRRPCQLRRLQNPPHATLTRGLRKRTTTDYLFPTRQTSTSPAGTRIRKPPAKDANATSS
jgi:hypothetical protein